jgi:hypothetical protein
MLSRMFDRAIEILLILLLIFTPLAFGSQVLWASSLMELGVLLVLILWAIHGLIHRTPVNRSITNNGSLITIALLALFLGFVLFQMIPLPGGMMKIISSKTYELRSQFTAIRSVTDTGSVRIPLSLFPLATKIEFFKWLALAGLFIFLLHWRVSDSGYQIINHLIIVVLIVGVFESLYGIFEFFSGHRHIFGLDWSSRISSVTGTFLNRNYFAGYLLMVIPLSIGFFFSREAHLSRRVRDWRHRLSSVDGKTLLVGFGLVIMILGIFLSGSRMGILSLLVSFSLVTLLFRNPHRRQRFSRVPVLILGLAVLWAAWIGLDAVISRFFSAPEGLKWRWMFWADTFQILKDFPLLGSGLGTFVSVFPMYRSFHIREIATHAENDFLQLASEVGLVGAGLLVILFLFLFFKAVSAIRSLSDQEPQRYVGIGGLIGILALMFHSIVERNIQVPANAFLYTVTWVMVLRIARDAGRKRIWF